MSTAFRPLALPAGVVATATKRMNSTQYAEVNMVRWQGADTSNVVSGQLQPIGGQSKYNYTFASRCKAIHTWYGLDQIIRTAYLCESNLYVDVGGGGSFIEITPTGGIKPPALPVQGGYSDGFYSQGTQLAVATTFAAGATTITMTVANPGLQPGVNVFNATVFKATNDPTVSNIGTVASFTGTTLTLTAPALNGGSVNDLLNFGAYNEPRMITPTAAVDRLPDAFSLSNFGAILLAMTSPDGRLLHWDPAVTANVNDVQTLTTTGGPTGGTFTLEFGAQTTGTIVYNATAANVQSALVALSNVGTGNVACTGGPLPAAVVITFQGALGNASQPTLVVANNSLTGGGVAEAPNIVHTTMGAGLLATPIAPSPGSVVPYGRCFVVTSERFVQIFGSYNDGTTGAGTGGSFRRFAWCDQENYTNWNYSDPTTQAGFIDIEPGSPIDCAIATRTGTVFFTAKKCYRSRYLGVPYVYNVDELGDNCTPWSPQSMASTSSMVLWFSQQGLYSYDGTSILPVACPVRVWIDDDIDILNVREQACACHVANFNEFWWFFPQGSNNNPGGFNTRAVIYNYKEGWWSEARMARSAGITASYTSHTIMANGTVAYKHEAEDSNVYWDCDLPWIETFDLNLLSQTSGSKLTTVKQLIPDIDGAVSNVLYSLFYRTSRSVGDPEMHTAPQPVRGNGYVDFRTTGRDIRLRIDLATPSGWTPPGGGPASDGSVLPVTVGQHLVDAVMRGDR